LLFDVGDWKKLGDHIRRLLDNPELRRSLADQAHSRIAALSLKSEQESWLEVYQLALGRPG
jgi:glycosyltransferase involved in cell wall biosynthesis